MEGRVNGEKKKTTSERKRIKEGEKKNIRTEGRACTMGEKGKAGKS